MSDDELEPLVTECPNCSTRFRVTENQLQAAAGRVRCGACLTVFQGVDYLLWSEGAQFSSREEAQKALDALLNELGPTRGSATGSAGEPAQDDARGFGPAASAPAAVSDAAGDFVQAPGLPGDVPFFGGFEDDAESDQAPWLESATADVPQGVATEDFDVKLYTVEELSAEEFAAEAPAAEETIAEELTVEEIAIEEPAGWQDPGDEIALQEDMAEDPLADAGADAVADEVQAPAVVHEPPPVARPAQQPVAAEREPAAGSGRAARVARSPDTLRFAPEPRRRWVPLAVAVGVLALVFQVGWYQFESWTRDPQLRPAYAWLCRYLGCELPVLRDVSKMVTRSLVVRSHPDQPGSLIVNALIINEAPFAQPFPMLEIRFTALNGTLVAGRRFTPKEYLAGELAGVTMLAPRTPVHIDLEIADPGSDAVNYFLRFL